MAIISAPDGTYYSNKTGKVYSREEVLSKIAEKQAQGNNSIFGKLFSGGTTSYEQTGAIDNAVKGDGGGVNDFATRAKNIVNANTVLETDSDKAARLREASNILGLDEQDSSTLMRGALGDDGIMKSALALAKKKQQEPDDWEQFAADHPATAKYLEQQKNAAISYDDVKPLGKLEDTVNTVKAHLEMMDVEQKIAELGRKYDSLNMSYNELSADQRVELNDLITKRQELQKNIDPWSVGNVLGGLISMKEDLPMALAVGAQTALLAGGVGAAVGGVGAIPAAISGFGAGFKVGMGASMGYRTAGTQYAENMMRADANGQYMDANSLRQGAWAAGLGMGVLGAVGTGRLTSKLPMGQVYDKFLRTTSPSVLNNPAARETAWRGYLSTLGVGLKEAAVQDVIFGGGGSALTYGSNRYSEALSGLDYSNREDGTLLQNIAAGMEQFAPMALGTGVGFSVGGRMMGNALGGKKAPMPVADGLNKVINALDETKTAQRSPQAARDMINTVFGDTASASDVSVDARGLVRLYQEADPDNPNRVYEVAEKLGVDAKTLDEAVATGGDVRVPVKDFALEFSSKGDSSNMRAEVLKEVRDIDGVTENERGEILNYEKQKINELKENMTAVTETDYDKSDPAYVAAADAVKSAYPKFGPKDSENMTKLVYAGFKQMEQNGVLKANGFDNAEQAIRAIEVRRKDAPENNSNLNQASEKTVDFSYTFGDNVAKEVFNKYLNDGIMGMVRDSVTKEIGEHIEQARIDLSKMADPIAREDARENIPYIRAMKTDFNQSFVQDNPAYKDRLAAKLEYARRCFDNDERIGKLGNVRQVDGDSRQEGVRRAGDAAVPESQSRGAGKGVRGENGGVQNGVSGGYRNARDHYEKLYNDIKKKHSDKQGAFRLEQADDAAASDVVADSVSEVGRSTSGEVFASYMPMEQGRAIIELYKHANPASLAHEMLHHWVTLHENAFKTGKMEGRVLEDFEKLAKFAGHELGTEWSTAEHEKLASAWETYLSEGRAPSLELAGAFSRFKQWMKRIYQTLTRHAIPINDDVRGVFDRMLASDAELALAEDFYANEPLFAGREMNETALREYAKLVISSHQEAQKEMDKRVMAEVNPAMKEVRDAAEKTIREDIAAQMQNEPVYAARMLFTAPRDTVDFKAARDKAIKAKIDERVDLLVKESAQGIDKRGEVVSEHGTVTENWFVGDSMNHDWYREMFKRRGGKIPASWYNFIKAYKAGEKPLSKMPKSMREEYEHIAEEQLTKGHKDSFLGDIPEDAEFINLKEGNPAMSWIVENGGGIRLDRASVYERYGKGALPERWLTDKNGYTLDDVADFVYDGKAGGDRLFEELTTKPTFSKELNKRVRAGMAEFKDNEYGTLRESAIKAVHNEKSLEAVAVELEIFEQMAAEMKAKNEQKTADAIAEGRKKAKVENKINEAKDAAAKKAAREQRMVDAAVARGTLRAKAAREMAKNQIADTAVGEIESWQKYAALGNRANKEAIRLMSKGDVEGAIEAKNREILCKALALEAGKADTEVKKMMRFFKRVNKRGNKMKGVPHEFNVQTDKIMANYGLLTREPLKGLDGEIPLRVFLYGDKENYPDYKCVVDTYDTPFVADFVLNNQKKPYSELTFNEIRDLKNSVESIRKIGRNADKTLADGKKRSIDEIAKKMVEKLGTHVQRYANASSMAEIKKPLFSLTDLKKPEMVLRLMDKGEENGIFVNNIYNPLKLGLDDYANRSREIIKDVEKIMSDSGYTQREIAANKTKYYTFDFVEGGKVTHEQILLLCMNWGNDGNRDRARYYLKTGAEHSKKQWTEQELAELDSRALQMFEKLTAKDLKLVQAVWDYLETYAPEIRKHEVECSGVDPNMVEATGFSVMTADGQNVTLRGGYFPIRYDPNKSVRAMDLDTANDLFKKNSAVQASVSHAHTKGRSQHIDRPLLLEWATFTDHLRNVNYDLAMRKPVRDVAKILSRADVQEAMAKTFGNDTVRMLNDWLRDIASDQRDMLKVSEKVLRWTRTRMSVAYLGLRTKALFIDLPQNVVTAYWQNGGNPPKEMLKFIFSGDYKAKIDFVNQRSPMMRDKYAFMDANLSDLRQDFMGDVGIVGKLTKGRVILPSNDKVQKLAFCVDSFADGAVNYPTWLQYHADAMARGLSDAEASLEADAKTRRQSVDTSKAGMAAIQRGSESLKLITPFYSYFNAYLNRLLYDYGMVKIKWADGQRLDSVGLAVRAVGLGMALPVMIEAIMQGYFLNNDQTKDKKKHAENIKKEMISAAISYPANTLPVVGQFVTTGVNKFIGKKNTRFELSPVESAFNTMTDTFGAIAKYSDSHGDAEAEKKLVEAMAKTAAVSAPYPNIINTWALNMWDVFAKGGDINLADIVTRRVNQK